jgi:serine/tyrosine/threonine adenylyltransferase
VKRRLQQACHEIEEVKSASSVRSDMAYAIASFSNSYARLPEHFFARVDPTPVAKPQLIVLNRPLAQDLGLDVDAIDGEALGQIFGGNIIPPGAEPISMAYAGHQFGTFVPQLGDGRAILLGEVFDRCGVRRDIQLKGAGRTPFSRRGDGRAALGPVLREYLVSEAMHALGIAATRALAAVTTGERVFRDTPLPGAILTRVAASHIRVGTFQYFAAREDHEAVRRLSDYVLDRHYPDAKDAEQPYLALLEVVARRQAALVARWMQVGFVHGVMNTDNMAVSGETIDFGPCAFIEAYDPAAVFSSIDELGRYAFGNQARAAQWNIARFAETLLPLIDPDPERAIELAQAVIAAFPTWYESEWIVGMRSKLGLSFAQDGDVELIVGLLDAMEANQADFTLTFRRICDAAADEDDAGPRALFADPGAYDRWAVLWRNRLRSEPDSPAQRAQAMCRVNPAVIPRNHRVQRALSAAVEREDFAPFFELLAVLSRPYEEQGAYREYAAPARSDERVLQTFCGT